MSVRRPDTDVRPLGDADMRILFITPYVPSVIRVRPYHFIRELSRRHEITLVCLSHADTDGVGLDEIGRYCEEVHTIPLSKTGSLVSCCRRLFTKVPLQAAYTESQSVRALIAGLISRKHFDMLHVEHIRGAHLAVDAGDLPKVYDSVDCITRLLEQFMRNPQNPMQRLLNYEELLKMRRYEPSMTSRFDKIVITSEHDKRALEELLRAELKCRIRDSEDHALRLQPEVMRLTRSLVSELQDTRLGSLSSRISPSVTVVRNGVDTQHFQPADHKIESDTIVFSGKMSYFANTSSVLHFYREVFPRIRARRPNARLKIVGSSPPDSVRRLESDPAVTVTGYVEDMREHIGSAAVVVCPMTVGVGIQNKMLEAMAMAKPVVCTSIACGGIPDAEDGRHLVRAGGAEEFAEHVVGLLGNPHLGHELGRNACELVNARYSWDAAARALEAVHQEAANGRPAGLPAAA